MADDNDLLIAYKILVNNIQALNKFKEFRDVALSLDKSITSLNFSPLKSQLTSIENNFKNLSRGTDNFTNKLDFMQKKLSRWRGNSMSGWGSILAVSGILTAITNPLINFEKAQAFLQGYGGFVNRTTGIDSSGRPYLNTQGQQLFFNPAQAMREEAMMIGATTIKTTTEAAEGLLSLAKMGWNIGKIARLGAPVTQLAIAGDISVADAGRIISMAINQFGDKANKYSRAAGESMPVFMMDQIVKAASISQINVKDMLQYLGRGGATSALSGLNFSQFLAIASVIKDATGAVSVTATGLRSAMIDMLAPTPRANFAYGQLGIQDVSGEVKQHGILGFIKKVNDSLRSLHLNTTQNVNFMNDIFGKQQAQAGAALLNQIDKIIDRTNQLNLTSAGKMQMINNYINNSLFGAWKLMLSRIENFIIVLGNSTAQGGGGLTQKLSTAMQNIAYMFQVLANMPNPMKKLIVDVLVLTGGLVAAGLATKILGLGLGLIRSSFTILIGILQIISFSVKAFGAACFAAEILVVGLKSGVEGLITALELLTGIELAVAAPFLLAAAAVAALIAGLVLLQKYMPGFGSGGKAPTGEPWWARISDYLIGEHGPGSYDTAKGNLKNKKTSSAMSDYQAALKTVFKTIFPNMPSLINLQQNQLFTRMPKALQVLSYVEAQTTGNDPYHLLDKSPHLSISEQQLNVAKEQLHVAKQQLSATKQQSAPTKTSTILTIHAREGVRSVVDGTSTYHNMSGF